jgi:hypothetical protein
MSCPLRTVSQTIPIESQRQPRRGCAHLSTTRSRTAGIERTRTLPACARTSSKKHGCRHTSPLISSVPAMTNEASDSGASAQDGTCNISLLSLATYRVNPGSEPWPPKGGPQASLYRTYRPAILGHRGRRLATAQQGGLKTGPQYNW